MSTETQSGQQLVGPTEVDTEASPQNDDGSVTGFPQFAVQAAESRAAIDEDEKALKTQSKPYTAAAFFHFKATGSLERHRAYHAAFESDAFVVDFKVDDESRDLTITVERAEGS